ncbi:MAG TPA: peptidoglycan-binding protein [Polyangiaceae bacterium]|nr:peptidoglycan-binding protein [Polyangiaceae bacterium]
MFDDDYLRACRSWEDLVLVAPSRWRATPRPAHYEWYELLRVAEARHVLRAELDGDRQRIKHIFCHVFSTSAYESTSAMLDALLDGLGDVFPTDDDPPRHACLYVARRKREPPPARTPLPVVDPLPQVPLTLPRGFLALETVDPDGAPVGHVVCEVVLADGEVRTLVSDERGRARFDPIVQGRCVIRVTSHDGGLWRPDDGSTPDISSSNDRARRHVVQRGESLTGIAHRYGISDWKRVWNDQKNDALRKKRKCPHVLWPGDELTLPPREVREIVRATDATYRLVVDVPDVEFRVILRDHHGRPFKAQAYELRLTDHPNEPPRTGSTDGAGKLVERVPVSVRRVRVALPARGLTWAFETNRLTPLHKSAEDVTSGQTSAENETICALQARLNALGFSCGETDGLLGPRTREALALFQRTALQREPADELDDVTADKLERLFGVLT